MVAKTNMFHKVDIGFAYQISQEDWKVDNVKVKDHSVIAKETPRLTKLWQNVTFGQVMWKKLHNGGHSHND